MSVTAFRVDELLCYIGGGCCGEVFSFLGVCLSWQKQLLLLVCAVHQLTTTQRCLEKKLLQLVLNISGSYSGLYHGKTTRSDQHRHCICLISSRYLSTYLITLSRNEPELNQRRLGLPMLIIIIIIITNEKIKVTLSRKRCRGTLQDYNKGEISKCQSKLWTNRNVFSWCLNGTREETVRRDGGIDWSMHAVQRRRKHDHLG